MWIETYTGKQFYPLSPNPDDVDILDIAHALSMKCRFGGHSSLFYSVAEHSVLGAAQLPQHLRKHFLLHDAAEAYMPDILRPIKEALTEFHVIEANLDRAIRAHFNLPLIQTPLLKETDERMLATEARQLFQNWHTWSTSNIPPFEFPLKLWTPAEAEGQFLAAFDACD